MRAALLALLLAMILLRIDTLPEPRPAPPEPRKLGAFWIPLRASAPMTACMPSMTALIGGSMSWKIVIHAGDRSSTIDNYQATWSVPGDRREHRITTTAGVLWDLLALEQLPCRPSKTSYRIDLIDNDDHMHEGAAIGADTAAGQSIDKLLADLTAYEEAGFDEELESARPIAIRVATTVAGHRYELLTADREIIVMRDDTPIATQMMTMTQLYRATNYLFGHRAARAPIATGELLTRTGTTAIGLPRDADPDIAVLVDALRERER